jgi:hypothetical protein
VTAAGPDSCTPACPDPAPTRKPGTLLRAIVVDAPRGRRSSPCPRHPVFRIVGPVR